MLLLALGDAPRLHLQLGLPPFVCEGQCDDGMVPCGQNKSDVSAAIFSASSTASRRPSYRVSSSFRYYHHAWSGAQEPATYRPIVTQPPLDHTPTVLGTLPKYHHQHLHISATSVQAGCRY